MSRAMLPASQRCPAHQAFAQALCPEGKGAKDAATEIYRLLEEAQRIYDTQGADHPLHNLAEQLIGTGHIIAHNLTRLREMGKGLKS